MGVVIAEYMDGENSLVDDGSGNKRLSVWDFKSRSPKSAKPNPDATPDETPIIAIYNGPPRVLEIGCGDGNWCFRSKKKYPEWIVEGVDDADHWSCQNENIILR